MTGLPELLKGLTCLSLAAFVYMHPEYYNSKYSDNLPPDAPDGAIEYFENSAGTASVTVFKDKVVLEGDDIKGGGGEMSMNEITFVKKHGYEVKIIARNENEMIIDFNLFGMSAAKEFTETVQDLVNDARARKS